MKLTLHPEALKFARKNKGWSQEKLSEVSQISLAQISRWERLEKSNPQLRSREKLSKALGVNWEALTKAPSPQGEEESKIFPTVQVNFRIDSSVKNALVLASRRYGIKQTDIIELAPLLFLIVAERSLAVREAHIEAIEKQFEDIFENSRKYAPILAATYFNNRDLKKAIDQERDLIKNKQLFEILSHAHFDLYHDLDFSFDESLSPFGNYLGSLIKDTPKDIADEDLPKPKKSSIEDLPKDIADEDLPKDIADEDMLKRFAEEEERLAEERVGTRYLSSPVYRIAANTLKEITGITGEQEFDSELYDLIAEGYIKLNDVIKERQNSSPDDYRDWLQKKHKEAKAIRDLGEEELLNEIAELL